MEYQRESTPERRLKRWKSLESLVNFDDLENTKESPLSKMSESSIEIFYIYDSESESEGKPSFEDSGIDDKTCHLDVLQNLEAKIDKLSDMIQEQGSQLSALQVSPSAAATATLRHAEIVAECVANVLAQGLDLPEDVFERSESEGVKAVRGVAKGARALLEALETQKVADMDKFLRGALTDFLQSEELKDRIVSFTASSIQELIQERFATDVTSSYMPLLERCQKRLLRQTTTHLDNAFKEIEAYTVNFSKSTYRASKVIKSSLEKHQRKLQICTPSKNFANEIQKSVTGIIERELAQWRKKVLDLLMEQGPVEPETPSPPPPPHGIPLSPPQPTELGKSAIEQLGTGCTRAPQGLETPLLVYQMSAAEINNKMKEGDINGSFEKALSAADLALVVAACRAADPAVVFASPCSLRQHVLLSLVQQLATDMVHDTQLKCRYLEESLININTEDPMIRKYLNMVIEDVCKHLSSFLKNYPSHMCSRNIKMIIMAAGSLLIKENCFKYPVSNTYAS